MFNPRWQAEFNTSDGTTAWVNSTAAGIILMIGPIGSYIVDRCGCRWGTVIGSTIAMAGYVASSFAPSIPILCLTFGVISGAGGGIANIAGIVVISKFFKKEVSMAQGIGSAGVGAGCFLLAMLQELLIINYGWRGALMVMAGIAANLSVFGMLFFTPDQVYEMFPIELSNFWVEKSEKSSKEDEIMNFDSEKSEDGKFSRDSSTLPLKYDSSIESSYDDMSENLPIEEYFYLWGDRRFLLLAASDFFSWLVQLIPYIHLPAMAATTEGLNSDDGTSLISFMGLFAAAGKIVFGSICSWTNLTPLSVFIPAQAIFGLVTVLSPFCSTYGSLMAFSVCFGFFSGCYALMIVITQDTMGDFKFPAAYGSLLFVEALGVMLGPPVAGILKDISGNYDSSLYISGSLLIISASFLLLLPRDRKSVV